MRSQNFTGGISQPCPAVVTYVEKYIPELIPRMLPVHSPMMCTAIYMKKYMNVTDELEYGLGSLYPMPGGLRENVELFWVRNRLSVR